MAAPSDLREPSAAAIAIGTAIISGVTGYFLGQGSSIGLFGRSRSQHGTHSRPPRAADSDEEVDDEDLQDHPLATAVDSNEECKLVLVVRTDLGMGKGKIAAQCSHATLACYKAIVKADPAHPFLRQWERLGQAKVALKVDTEDDMLLLQAQAISLGLCAKVIHDAGRTQIASGSATVLGIGPAPKSKIDQVTGHLKLL